MGLMCMWVVHSLSRVVQSRVGSGSRPIAQLETGSDSSFLVKELANLDHSYKADPDLDSSLTTSEHRAGSLSFSLQLFSALKSKKPKKKRKKGEKRQGKRKKGYPKTTRGASMAVGLTGTVSLPIWHGSKIGNRAGHLRRAVMVSGAVKPGRSDKLVFNEPETTLIEALLGVQGRGRGVSPKQLLDVEHAVKSLEISKGVPDPTSSNLIEGSWQLIFTTRPGTASPIQRTFVAVDSFKIFQEVYLRTDDPRVTNVVRFSDAVGELRVEAVATAKDGKRILFRFDRAAFSFKFLPFKVPYPVPFRLLGDEAKGWLDTTYLSDTGNIRISKGNKGTTFVLQKVTEPRQKLLSAISTSEGILEAIEELISSNMMDRKRDLESLVGEWQLLWASESDGESWSSVASKGLKGTQIIKQNGQVENWALPFPGSKVTATGTLIEIPKSTSYSVVMNEGAFQFGPLKLPFDVAEKFVMEILYVDSKIRVGRIDRVTVVYLSL